MMTALLFDSSRERSSKLFTFHHAYQPIFSLLDDCVVGYESLIRNPEIKNPEELFSLAIEQNRLFDLDILSISNSIQTFAHQAKHSNAPRLSVNVFPSTLLEPSFLIKLDHLMSNVSLEPDQITFELNEAESVESLNKLKTVTHYLKRQGFGIALDDLGKGQSSLKIALELEPDIVKLDRYFSIDLDQSVKKQSFLEWISAYFISEGVAVTLEGIETGAELAIAKQAGIQFGQGYYLGRPGPQLLYAHI
jgi:EAL domain-containing protein (putative c-di-GMP-specific phosphodiesterase class I)